MKLEFWRADLRLSHTWAIARGSTDVFRVVLVKLTAPDGTIGLGESAPANRYGESVETVENFYRRVDAQRLSFDDIAASAKYLENLAGGNMAAKCGLNVALLDGAARRAKQPLHDFLELGFRENHHRTSFSIGISSPEETRQKVLAAAPFPILKLKLGSPKDRENFSVVRELAPEKKIRIDANEAWQTKETALEMIEFLAADGAVEFVEQPMPSSTSFEDLVWLKRRSPLPIFGDESYHTAADAGRCAECFHGVNVKLIKTGGPTGAVAALRAAREAGLKTMLGCMIETSVLISAAAHLAELCDYLDLDGNLLITNDPYRGVAAKGGVLSFAGAREKFGLRVAAV